MDPKEPPPLPLRRRFGNIHKINGNVLAALHTFLINNLLIFNFFSVIMYIQRDAKTVSHTSLPLTTLSFSYLSFLFGKARS